MDSPRDLGRYILHDPIASGGMATVHFGRMRGAVGFSRLVAIKRLHQNFVGDPSFVQMFLDEARLAARLDHPNVVKTLDVVADETEVFLVMEHILGESLESLMPRGEPRPVPLPIASAILCAVLEGLHSAHEARSDTGEPLAIVHRDVSPHNVLIGVDGVPRVFDFGIAKAAINTQETREGVIKGKVTYMAPEQVWGNTDRRADLYAAGVILWELVAGRRRHAGERNDALFLKLAKNALEPCVPPSSFRADAPPALDDVIAAATAAHADDRFPDARAMAVALEAAVPPAPARDVAAWVREQAGERIERRTASMRRIEAEVQSAHDARPTLPESSRTRGALAEVTGSITRATGLAHSVRPAPGVEAPVPRPRGLTMPLALVAFTAVLLLVGLRTFVRPSPLAQAAPPPPVAIAPPVPEPTASVVLVEEPVEIVVDAGRPRPAWTPPVVAPRPRPPEAVGSAAPSATHRANCENPFTIGADGIRQIKPECL